MAEPNIHEQQLGRLLTDIYGFQPESDRELHTALSDIPSTNYLLDSLNAMLDHLQTCVAKLNELDARAHRENDTAQADQAMTNCLAVIQSTQHLWAEVSGRVTRRIRVKASDRFVELREELAHVGSLKRKAERMEETMSGRDDGADGSGKRGRCHSESSTPSPTSPTSPQWY